MDFQYKKSLGQNFIYDKAFLAAIVRELGIKPTERIIEIGTGAGTLTRVLADTGADIKTIEIDRRLELVLTKEFAGVKNIALVFADVMKTDFGNEPAFRVVANVPYYITTPIIMKFLALPNCTGLDILVAGDVAKRITAKHGTPEYGALSVTCQLAGKCKIVKSVGKELFTPRPKIDSAFVRIIKTAPIADFNNLGRLLKGVFAARRKTILNALVNAGYNKDKALGGLAACGVKADLRPEQLPPTKFAELCQIMTNSAK